MFERVISLGWSPERFGSFDDAYGLDSGRSSHKPERFGKKYQWIALRELVARLADNFHMTEPYGDEPVSYEGPWRFYGRDIDPTLPPASRVRDDEDELLLGATFPPSGSDDWWAPQEPRYSREDPLSEGDWTTNTDDVPSFEPLVFKIDSDGVKWIALQAYYNWDEELEDDEERESRRRRDMWSHISSWLVDPADRTTLVSFLESRTLMGKWMPEGRELIDDAYLAEMPWAFSTTEYPDEWREAWSRNPEDEAPSPRVYPAWVEYLWEGNILDCSIDDAVGARLPAPLLFETGALTWRPGTREWYAAGDRLVAQHCTSRDGSHSALLVRDEWLKQVLKELGMALVVGWLGEKRLLESGWGSGYVNGWTEINAIASLAGSKWTFGQRRIEHKMPAQR